MRSNKEQLESRGYIAKDVEKILEGISFDELISSLRDHQAITRSISARMLSGKGYEDSIEPLCMALENESKLYTKIEISNALASYGKKAVPSLIRRLGKIGKNQHDSIPGKSFDKASYPLPRDIVARTLIRIGPEALPGLADVLRSDDITAMNEAIDAIGFICFYHQEPSVFPVLLECYHKNRNMPLTRWKMIRAMGSFPDSLAFLNNQYDTEEHPGIKQEIIRSIRMIRKRCNGI